MNKKYKIEVSESQLRVIAQALEDVCRISSGQLQYATVFENTLRENFVEADDNYFIEREKLEEKLFEIKKIIRPNLSSQQYLSYNSTEFIGNTYQLYRTMLRELHRGNNNVYDSEPLPSGNLGKLKIEEL